MHFNNVIGTVNRYVLQIKRDKFPFRRGGQALDRRGAETNERCEFVEAGWWNQV